jgi:predicted DNA-binding transcriptional regulator YafY
VDSWDGTDLLTPVSSCLNGDRTCHHSRETLPVKASRLLTLLLLLQARQRVTTGELAERLEVSRRTVLRDVEALSAAGVPVYAERGRHGGIVLLPGARLNASHLDPGEIEALSLTGLDLAHLQQLGLADAAEQAAHKLAARRAPGATGSGAHLSTLVIADNAAWMTAPTKTSPTKIDVAGLAMDLRARQRLELRYRRSADHQPTSVVVDPYGLAVKGGRWYLVADVEAVPRMFATERLVSYEVLGEPARVRAGHTLATVWAQLRAQVEQVGRVMVEARLRRSRVDLAHRVLGSRMTEIRHHDDEWCHVTIRYEEVEAVRQLLQFGDHIEVLAPAGARDRIHELACDLVARHGPKPIDLERREAPHGA